MIKSFPFWLTAIPRLLTIVLIILIETPFVYIVMIGYKRGTPIDPIRRFLVKKVG